MTCMSDPGSPVVVPAANTYPRHGGYATKVVASTTPTPLAAVVSSLCTQSPPCWRGLEFAARYGSHGGNAPLEGPCNL